MLFTEARDSRKREEILSSPVFKNALTELERERQHYLATPIESLTFHFFKLFYTEGDRRKYEDLYFAHRGRLATFSMAVLLYDRQEDLEALEDIIWAICDEYTWVLPAHSADLGDRYDTNIIDLFGAETGFALAEIDSILGRRLDEKIRKRLRDCLEDRIFTPYLSRHFFWEKQETNWAAVCAGSVGATFLYAAPERFNAVRTRILDTLNCFLRGFGTDGACLEGIGYWNYGFGYFTYFSQLLLEFTDGKIDLFTLPICEKIAMYQQNTYLRKNFTVSFSDGYMKWFVQPGLTQKLQDVYGSKIQLQPLEYAEFDDNCHRFASYLRNFFWTNQAPISSDKHKKKLVFYPSAGWYLYNTPKLSLAAKAGHNGEPHNHNDVGSFSLISDSGQILCDFGCGEYNRAYFAPDTRYTFLCNSSKGHNLPIINGKGQSAGECYHGTVISADESGFSLEIKDAYEECGLTSLRRELTISEKGFVLCDRFSFSGTGNSVTERFVSMHKPAYHDGELNIMGFQILYEGDCQPELTSSTFLDHFSHEVTMYIIDFPLTNPEQFTLRVTSSSVSGL